MRDDTPTAPAAGPAAGPGPGGHVAHAAHAAHGSHGGSSGHSGPGATTAGTALAVTGLVLLVLALTGRLTPYLRPGLALPVALTALVLIVLSTWTLAQAWSAPARQERTRPRPGAALLLVPVLLAALAAPAPLGSALLTSTSVAGGAGPALAGRAVERAREQAGARLGRNADGTVAYPALPTGSVTELSVEDLANRWALGPRDDLDGRQVTVLGFASPGQDGGWLLGRFRIYCCAADALAFQVSLHGAPALTTDQWYRVTGTVDTSGGGALPVIEVTGAEPVAQPRTPYL